MPLRAHTEHLKSAQVIQSQYKTRKCRTFKTSAGHRAGHLYPVRDIESQYRTFRAGAGYLEPAQDIRHRCRSSKAGARDFRSVQEFQTGTVHLEVTQGSWRQHRSCRSSTGHSRQHMRHLDRSKTFTTSTGQSWYKTLGAGTRYSDWRKSESAQDTQRQYERIRGAMWHLKPVLEPVQDTRSQTRHISRRKTFGAVTGQPAQYTQSQYGTLIWHRTFRARTRP